MRHRYWRSSRSTHSRSSRQAAFSSLPSPPRQLAAAGCHRGNRLASRKRKARARAPKHAITHARTCARANKVRSVDGYSERSERSPALSV
jgi:hypothetical protein